MKELLETGFVLMGAGMGTVFVLLAVLVLVVHGVSKFSRWVDPRSTAALPLPQAPTRTKPTPDTELVTVIGAAVAAYRRDHTAGR